MKKKTLCGLVVFAFVAILISGCGKPEEKKAKTTPAKISETEKAANEAAEQQRLAAEKAKADAEAAEQKRLAAEKAKAMAEAAAAREKAAQFENDVKELGAVTTDRGLTLTLGDVAFGANSADLKPEIMPAIERLADFLKKYPERRVLVEGFTDSRGNAAYNQKLSERRALAVRQALVDRDIENTRIDTKGYGEAFPVATNKTAAGRQMNRRVEIIISDEAGSIPERSN